MREGNKLEDKKITLSEYTKGRCDGYANGYKEGYDKGFEAGFNTAIEIMKNKDKEKEYKK